MVAHWLIVVLIDVQWDTNWDLLELPDKLAVVFVPPSLHTLTIMMFGSLIDGQMNGVCQFLQSMRRHNHM